jgi:hypothetical protein
MGGSILVVEDESGGTRPFPPLTCNATPITR